MLLGLGPQQHVHKEGSVWVRLANSLSKMLYCGHALVSSIKPLPLRSLMWDMTDVCWNKVSGDGLTPMILLNRLMSQEVKKLLLSHEAWQHAACVIDASSGCRLQT